MQFLKILTIRFCVLLAFCTAANAQTISGFVRDSTTDEALIGATIRLITPENTTFLGVTTNESGFFALNTGQQLTEIIVECSYIGYATQRLNISAAKDTILYIQMENTDTKTKKNKLKTVTITAERPIETKNEMGVVQIPMAQVHLMPRLFGEADIMRVLQLTPGVQGGREGTSALYVRGGTPDQNLVLLDESPLYYVNHLGGFLSVFDENAINSFKIIKGGFPARYGSRLSSVLDIRMKDGNTERIKGSFELGILTMKGFVEGPLTKNKKTTFFASVRRSNFDLLSQAYFLTKPDAEFKSFYTVYDINAKITHRFSERDRLSVTGYWGEDGVSLYTKAQLTNVITNSYNVINGFGRLAWGNGLINARHTHVFSSKLFGSASLGFTRFNYISDNKQNQKLYADSTKKDLKFDVNSGFQFKSVVEDISLRTHLEYSHSSKLQSRVGGQFILHQFTPGAASYQSVEQGKAYDSTLQKQPIIAPEIQVYTEQEWQITPRLSTNLGLHFSAYTPYSNGVAQNTMSSLQPRAVFNYQLPKHRALKASFARMTQYAHLLTNSGVGFPVDIWVPATERAPAQNSLQYSLGMVGSLPKKGLEWSVEGFYKTMDNLIDYSDGSTFFFGSSDWQDKIEINGLGRVYGAEAFLQKKEGKTTGWLSYCYSVNERRFDNQNKGNWYPFRYDQTHAFSVAVQHQFSPKFALSASWTFHTGNAYTLPNRSYYVPTPNTYIANPNEYTYGVFDYTSKNGFRMPAYHRLDLNFCIKTKKNKRGKQNEWNISVYNAYYNNNPYFIFIERQNFTNQIKIKSFSLFPALPSFSFGYKF